MSVNTVVNMLIITLAQWATKALAQDSTSYIETIELAFTPSPEPGSEDFCRVRFAEWQFCCATNQCLPNDECIRIEVSNLFLSYGVVFTQVFIVVVGLVAMVIRAGKFRKYNKLLEKNRRSSTESIEES